MIVEPLLGEAEAGLCAVAFQETGPHDPVMNTAGETAADAGIQTLEHELRTVKTQLQSTIDGWKRLKRK